MNQTPIDRVGASKGNFKSYAIGFILSMVLTAVAFALVMQGEMLPRWAVFLGIFGTAIVQILVHLHYFLHLDASSTASWNVTALVFTVLIIILFVGGTLWIMSNLNYRMM